MALLEIRDLWFSYKIADRSVDVLKDLNLSIEEGDFLAIQGSSGSGKSTLLYMLGCLLRPDRGSIRLDGQDITALNPRELAVFRNRKIGFIFQQFHLLPRATVLDNILLPTSYPCETASRTPEQEERARELATRLGLAEHLHHLPNQLSGGQQQRVAIARALMNDAKIILADEPTGNLDSRNATQIVELLRELNRQGKTIVIITHDGEIARQCARIKHIRDGSFTSEEVLERRRAALPASSLQLRPPDPAPGATSELTKTTRSLLPLAWDNLKRNKARSVLTMLGITIGIASVLAMVTLGQFTKQKILSSYEQLGVNKLNVRGWRNWEMKATERVSSVFQSFQWEKDLLSLFGVFPQIRRMSPVLQNWQSTVNFGGRSISSGVRVFGVNEDYLEINNREIMTGKNFSAYHLINRNPVCLIGSEVASELFTQAQPVGQIIYITMNDGPFVCRVIGVMKPQTSNSEWVKPNLQILIPYTYFPAVANRWDSEISSVLVQVRAGEDAEKVGNSIKAFFQRKYGKSGKFYVDSDGILVAQMKKFLDLFAILLSAIALISLAVGGMGITNMMLVSVSERFKEIGLRKALGATDFSIRVQFLLEAILLCGIAGLIGVLIGFSAYELLIYVASRFVSKLQFEWILMPGAILLSFLSIVAVGIVSGIGPAVKAERLQVIEALRSE